ncbi:MAG: hypothetical protein ACRD2F_01375 [Terriglobales bacterium]
MGSSSAARIMMLALAAGAPLPHAHRPRRAFPFPAFTAEMITASPVASPVRVRIYRAHDRLRVDLPQGGYQIFELKSRRAYRIAPGGRCAAIAFRPPPGAEPFVVRGQLQRKRTGTVRRNGQSIAAEQITVRGRRGRHVFVAWVAGDGFPLRVQMVTPAGPLEVLYRQVRLVAPAASLLRLPASCGRAAKTAAASANRETARSPGQR